MKLKSLLSLGIYLYLLFVGVGGEVLASNSNYLSVGQHHP